MRPAIWRRRDVIATASAGSAGLTLGYYWLLTRDSSLHELLSGAAGTFPYFPLVAVLLVLTVALFGANIGLLGLGLRIRMRASASAGSVLGAVAGGFGVGCPTCGAYLLSLVGAGSGLAALPLGGLEIWGFAALVMSSTLWRSHRLIVMATCDTATGVCNDLPHDSRRQSLLALSLTAALVVSTGALVAVYR